MTFDPDHSGRRPSLDLSFGALLARRRHDRLERSKEILRIVQSVVIASAAADDDQLIDRAAERLSVLIFGK